MTSEAKEFGALQATVISMEKNMDKMDKKMDSWFKEIKSIILDSYKTFATKQEVERLDQKIESIWSIASWNTSNMNHYIIAWMWFFIVVLVWIVIKLLWQ